MALRARLAASHAPGNDDNAEKAAGSRRGASEARAANDLVGRKAQDVGVTVDPAKVAVQLAHGRVADQGDCDRATRAGGRDSGKPPRQSGSRHRPAPRVSHDHPQASPAVIEAAGGATQVAG